MRSFDYWTNLDSHPMTGTYKTDFLAKAVVKPWTEKFFDGSEGYEQVSGVTPGKIYRIIEVECFGDVSDFTFINDNEEEDSLGSFFFEDAKGADE